MIGQSLRHAGVGHRLPSSYWGEECPHRSLYCSSACFLVRHGERGQEHHICTAISRSAGPKSAVLRQQSLPVIQSEELGLKKEEVTLTIDTSEGDRVTCTFRWPAALPGQDVSVVGSFTDWQDPIVLRRSSETNDFIRTVALQPGTYQYKYLVDGQWLTSPVEPVTSDGQGTFNNQRLVSPSATFHWKASWGGDEVFLAGDFTAWAELVPLKQEGPDTDFRLSCSLPPGAYCYQYLVDGTWMTSPDTPVGPDDDGHLCNRITVEVLPAFQIFYATGWEDPVLRVRALSAAGEPQTQGWRDVPMQRTPSRASPSGGRWRTATIPATGDPAQGPPQLEFTVINASSSGSSGNGKDCDAPTHAASYRLRCPGGFKLQHGRLHPFPRACAAASMLVSDLDGTMVGDDPEADAGTEAFCRYWEDSAALSGGVLVYNTGRSLGQFKSLWQEKRGLLALPDVLITAVGTKIFMLDTEEQSRSEADGQAWKEDTQWASILDQDWDLRDVRQVAGEVISAIGPDQAQWLDDGSEHPHRIALSVQSSRVEEVCRLLADGCLAKGVKVRVIVSGTGGWRYVDCVSSRAGKLQALERVRALFSVPRDRCVAAGDSGNDILMLEGKNPAIVVGNAQPTLVDWLAEQPQNGRIVFTDASIARGILEGLCRHGLF